MSITIPNSTQYEKYLCLFTSNNNDKRARLYLSELKQQSKTALTRTGSTRFQPAHLSMDTWDAKTTMYFRNKYGLGDNDTHIEWFCFMINFIFNRHSKTMAQLNASPAAGQPPSTKGSEILEVIKSVANANPGSVEDLIRVLIGKMMSRISDGSNNNILPNPTNWDTAVSFTYKNSNALIAENFVGTSRIDVARLTRGFNLYSLINTIPGWTPNNLENYLAQRIGAAPGMSAIDTLEQFFIISNRGIKPNELVSWNQINSAAGVMLIPASSDPAFIAQSIVQMWRDIGNLCTNAVYGNVAGGVAAHQQEIYNLFSSLFDKLDELVRDIKFGYNYDKFLINSMLTSAVNNLAIPTASNNLMDFSDVQDDNQQNEKYIRDINGLLHEVKPDGTRELVEANSNAIQNLKEADKCIGTGFESHPGSTKTCYEYLQDCLKGGDVNQCKEYLRDPGFWQNASKEVDKMQPLVAYQTLKSFEFGRVQKQINNRTIDRVQTWAEWIDSIKNKLNQQELTDITSNIKLQEYLNLIIKKVNDNPAILNKDYIQDKAPTTAGPDADSVLGKFGLVFAPRTEQFVSNALRLKQLSDNNSRQVGLILNVPGVLPGVRFNLIGGSNSMSEAYLQDTLKQQNALIFGAYKSLKQKLSNMGKNISPSDDTLIIKLIDELKLRERKLHKLIVMTERYIELLKGHGVQDPNSSLTTDHLEKFVEQRNNYFKKVQTKQSNLMSIIQSIADSVQSLTAKATPAVPLKSTPLGNY